jgi:hypothetical protein
MKKLIIKKEGLEVQQCLFENEQSMQDFIKLLADQAPWGKPDRWIADTLLSPLTEEEKAKATDTRVVNDGLGNGWTEYFFPAEYTIEIEDITAQIEAEQAQIQAIKNAQLQAGLRLQQFPSQVDACQDLDALKLAIKQMVQDIAVLLR